MKKIFSLIILGVSGFLLLPNSGQAQVSGYLGDVSRYNQTISGGGTARIRAMGGASASLGGDLSSAYVNPAGLGFYNRSEFSITPTFFSNGNDATYLGSSNYQYQNNFNISNLGFAFRGNQANTQGSGWLGGTFAITYQQLNNFSNNFNYQGSSTEGSYVDSFLQYDDATLDNFINQGDLHTVLAFDSYLIDDNFSEIVDGNEVFFYDTYFPLASADYPVLERESVTTSGSQGQWNFSYGGNFNDKFYIGGGIGVSSITYRKESVFSDEVSSSYYRDASPDQQERFSNNRFEMTEDLRQEGGGINATLGVIARPVDYLTVGLSYRTPTFYSIEETYWVSYTTEFLNNSTVGTNTGFAESELLTFNYNLQSPAVVNAGASYFIGKNGVITGDLEYINYSNSRLTDNYNELSEDNQSIPEVYGTAINYRLGGELRYESLRFRLGYAHQASPYEGINADDYSSNTFSGGVGLRLKNFFTDLAILQQRREILYIPMARPDVTINNRQTSALLTLGVNF